MTDCLCNWITRSRYNRMDDEGEKTTLIQKDPSRRKTYPQKIETNNMFTYVDNPIGTDKWRNILLV